MLNLVFAFFFILKVKGGGAIPPKGTAYTLEADSKDDFRRDVLKSDTAVLEIPQLELVMEMGTLGSMYTTVEGLLEKVLSRGRLRSAGCEEGCFFLRSGRANTILFKPETRLGV